MGHTNGTVVFEYQLPAGSALGIAFKFPNFLESFYPLTSPKDIYIWIFLLTKLINNRSSVDIDGF